MATTTTTTTTTSLEEIMTDKNGAPLKRGRGISWYREEFKISKSRAKEIQNAEAELGQEFEGLRTLFEKGIFYKQNYEAAIEIILDLITVIVHRTRPLITKKTAIFMIGETCAGKSTFANWLLGGKFNIAEAGETDDEDSDDDSDTKISIAISNIKHPFKVGHDLLNSETFLPTVRNINSTTVIVDYPGFFDSYGKVIRIAMDIAFRELLKIPNTTKVIALLPITACENARGASAAKSLDKLRRLLPPLGRFYTKKSQTTLKNAFEWAIGITKCSKPFTNSPNASYKIAQTLIDEHIPMLSQYVFNINTECLFPSSRRKKKGNFYTPQQFLAKIPSGPKIIDIDILDDVDITFFKKVANSTALKQHALVAIVKSNPSDFYEELTRYEETINVSFDDLLQQWKESVIKAKTLAENIATLSVALKKKRQLALENTIPLVKRICAYNQPKLKNCFLDIEKELMMEISVLVAKMVTSNQADVKQIIEDGFLIKEHILEYDEALKEVGARLQNSAEMLGYDSTDEMIRETTGNIAGPTALIGVTLGTAALGFEMVSSASMAASGLAIAGWSTQAVLVSATGIGLIVTGGVAAAMYWRHRKKLQEQEAKRQKHKEKSEKLKKVIIQYVQYLGQAVSAATRHVAGREKLKGTLNLLIIEQEE